MRRPASLRSERRRYARAAMTLVLAAGLAACGPDAPAPPSSPPRTPSSAPVAPTPPPVAAPSAPTAAAPTAAAQPGEVNAVETWDAAGLAVERLPGDAIRVRGTDRWGARIDTTYADVTYFANAVPVFSRGLRDDQARAVTELLPRVRAATSAPSTLVPPASATP